MLPQILPLLLLILTEFLALLASFLSLLLPWFLSLFLPLRLRRRDLLALLWLRRLCRGLLRRLLLRTRLRCRPLFRRLRWCLASLGFLVVVLLCKSCRRRRIESDGGLQKQDSRKGRSGEEQCFYPHRRLFCAG